MKVAKRFRWEGVHRLPWHTGGCQNIHGHSYIMWVEFHGEIDDQGMLIDFKEIKKILDLLVASWDHATLVAVTDSDLLKAIEFLKAKHYILPYDTTSENLCLYVTEYLAEHATDLLDSYRITAINVKLQETETYFAEYKVIIYKLRASIEKKAAFEYSKI